MLKPRVGTAGLHRPPRLAQHTRHRGAVLVVGMIILLVLTILGVSGMRNSVLQELMAGHARDTNAAFQAAEGAMQAGLDFLASRRTPPIPSSHGDSIGRGGTTVEVWSACLAKPEGSGVADPRTRLDSCRTVEAVLEDWRSHEKGGTGLLGQVVPIAPAGTLVAGAAAATEWPRYIIETRFVPQSDDTEEGSSLSGTHYSTVIAVGYDANAKSRVILRTTIRQQYDSGGYQK